MKYCLLLMCTLFWIANNPFLHAKTVNPERLWLPPSAAHMMPALEEAAQRALAHPECAQVLYGRLNEFRTENNEPAMTILCQIDARNTFNLVFRVDELITADDNDGELIYTTDNAESNLEALRRALMSNPGLIPQENSPSSGNTESVPENTESAEPAASRSLELDLDELLRRPPPQTDDAPEIF